MGLNIPRPAGLISMFRGENVNHPSKSNCNKEMQTDEPTLNESNSTYHLYSENKSAGNEDSFVDVSFVDFIIAYYE